jgi:hypothetical protein
MKGHLMSVHAGHLLLGLALAAAPVVAVTTTAAPAEARACLKTGDISRSGNSIFGSREMWCDPPGAGSPLEVTIQRKAGTSWVTVAHGDADTGFASYTCTPGTYTHTYRLKEATQFWLHANCS